MISAVVGFAGFKNMRVSHLHASADLKEHSVLLRLGSRLHSFGHHFCPLRQHCAHQSDRRDLDNEARGGTRNRGSLTISQVVNESFLFGQIASLQLLVFLFVSCLI